METSDDPDKNKKPSINGFTKEINTSALIWPDHITSIDLSNKNLVTVDDCVKFPPNVVDLNLAYNALREIPSAVLGIAKLKNLDISNNSIKYFDDTPSFCHSIETLKLGHNSLEGPPYWIWTANPRNLTHLDLNYNIDITESFKNGYFEELLQYKTPVVHLIINNCKIGKHLELLSTFPKVKVLEIGSEKLSHLFTNRVLEVPCGGLENCCDLEKLNLSNTHIYNVVANIDMFVSLVEINLSQNYISGLPNEFCNLHNLKCCILSFNQILYLPDEMRKLKNLVVLLVDSNELCTLPDSLVDLKNLEVLDVYNNCLYEIPDEIMKLAELDLAQNYFDEPDDETYLEKKEKLRLNIEDRCDGRKLEQALPDSEHSSNTTDDEELIQHLENISKSKKENIVRNDPPSSPEDWDSDDYWVPRFCSATSLTPHEKWIEFVKRKMEAGNFCPVDAHPVSITEKVKYEKLCNPQIVQEVIGQFDDLSDDDS
ncbi:protein scribble homolog [Ostrinia furnacalis]|uniref:protein scribble homolog n=1 Tax=Ostrinia furnacalis TaxID=93504 RepID=UPI00103D1C64|nr:protein scribble homolog [Ostrinia furnacalis]